MELIDTRKKEDVEKLLIKYKNVKYVTRDRASSYGSAIKSALPNAKQIADYFHLCINLTEKGKEYIRDIISGKIYFNEKYEITKTRKEARHILQRSKIEDIMYHIHQNTTQEEKRLIRAIFKQHKEIKIFLSELQKFKNIINSKDQKSFRKLIKKWQNGNISVLKTFTNGIILDYEAVMNAVKYGLTNGLAEGKINKLKTIKRQIYGRAKSDLLYAILFLSDHFQRIE